MSSDHAVKHSLGYNGCVVGQKLLLKHFGNFHFTKTPQLFVALRISQIGDSSGVWEFDVPIVTPNNCMGNAYNFLMDLGGDLEFEYNQTLTDGTPILRYTGDWKSLEIAVFVQMEIAPGSYYIDTEDGKVSAPGFIAWVKTATDPQAVPPQYYEIYNNELIVGRARGEEFPIYPALRSWLDSGFEVIDVA